MKFVDLSEQWLAIKQNDIGNSQYVSYRCALNHLKPLFAMDVSDIRVVDIQAIITSLAAYNPMTKRPTAKKTLRDVKHTAKQILQYAIELREIDYNAAMAVRVPKNAPKRTRRAITDHEREVITNTPHEMQTAAMLFLYAGLRRGEAIPLQWKDVDLEKKTISVNKAVDLSKNKPEIKTPKTESGNRTVIIPEILANYLKMVKPIYASDDQLVIFHKLHTSTTWRKHWQKYISDIGLRDITAHMLRHTACTMMIESGMDVSSVKMQMGHSDIQVTLNIYTHVTEKHQKIQVDKLDAYLKSSEKNHKL